MDFELPELGEGVYEAELIQWQIAPGDVVRPGDTLLEVLTDKANMDVPSPFAGRVNELLAKPGDAVRVGQKVLSFTPMDDIDSNAGDNLPGEQSAAESSPAASASSSAPVAVTARPNVPPARESTGRTPDSPRGVSPRRFKAAPSVRRMARALEIDLAKVHGSGRGGRILIEDLTQFAQSRQPLRSAEKPEPRPAMDLGVAGTRIPMTGVRRKIAEHMVRSKTTIPHYAYVDECDVSELVRLRASLKEPLAQQGVRLTYLAFVVAAVVEALKQVPLVNASYDEEAGEILIHDCYHIGIAATTERGLVVPVIHNADRLDLAETAREIERLSNAARHGTITRDEMQSGTFTVTSIGGIGGLISTPVINYPEVGICGIGKIIKRPVYNARGELTPADLMYLSFSFDHRVVDGAVGAVFGNHVRQFLENPARLLLPGLGKSSR